MHRFSSDTPLSNSESELGETEQPPNAISKEKSDSPCKMEQTAKKYDESLLKALHHAFFKQIWFAAILLGSFLLPADKELSTRRNGDQNGSNILDRKSVV